MEANSSVVLSSFIKFANCDDGDGHKNDERWSWGEQSRLLLQCLPQGPVPPSGPSCCTHNPNAPHCGPC